jgi:tRNA modification GTPase
MSAASRTERWDRLPNVVLAGQPNAGKSSLFNRLTGVDRVIASPTAGTTRDVISAPLVIGGIECLLIDSPGLMQNASGLDADAVAQTQLALCDADLIIEVVDVTDQGRSAIQYGTDRLVMRVGNKADLLNASKYPMSTINPAGTGFLSRTLQNEIAAARFNIVVSATTGENCEQLKALIATALHERQTDAHDSAIAMMSEYRDALENSIAAIDRAVSLARASSRSLHNTDLVALELHAAANELGVLVGQDQTEEMLGRIFARFCVGK